MNKTCDTCSYWNGLSCDNPAICKNCELWTRKVWEPNPNDMLHKLNPALDALDNMLDTLKLDKSSRDAIREFFRKYTLFVVDLDNYGIVAYNEKFKKHKLFVDDEEFINELNKQEKGAQNGSKET